jgi:hypothetical protein
MHLGGIGAVANSTSIATCRGSGSGSAADSPTQGSASCWNVSATVPAWRTFTPTGSVMPPPTTGYDAVAPKMG